MILNIKIMNDPNSIIDAQKEQIARYQSRLKGEWFRQFHNCTTHQFPFLDVVTAYKSLLKEKEALDLSLAALSSEKSKETSSSDGTEPDDMSKQMNTVMNSLATLSAEKSRMEASFQTDKKNMRQEMAIKDKELKETHEKLKNVTMALNSEKENYKAKLVKSDRMLNDERHLKENLETQLNQLKTQFSQTSNSDKVIKDLNQELADARKKLKAYESNQNKFKDESTILQALQTEMDSLKQQHITNLMAEKQRSNEASERSRKLQSLHEERVQSLEARLTELSISVAHYHNLRETDQRSITLLKEKLLQINKDDETLLSTVSDSNRRFVNVPSIIEEIERLKHLLIYENNKLETPMDLQQILSNPSGSSDAKSISYEIYAKLKHDHDKLLAENETMKLQLKDQSENVRTLQAKVQVLNHNIEDFENEIKNKSIEINSELKAERTKWRESINSMEIEYRSKLSQLEQQLQKQRERSLTLLEEKENEIRSLKTSYELFLPKKSSIHDVENDDEQTSECGSSIRRKHSTSQHLGMVLNQPPSSNAIPETHMIYYSNELARKDMELASIRKAKREAENLIRQTLKEKIMMQEDLDDKIMQLEQHVDR